MQAWCEGHSPWVNRYGSHRFVFFVDFDHSKAEHSTRTDGKEVILVERVEHIVPLSSESGFAVDPVRKSVYVT